MGGPHSYFMVGWWIVATYAVTMYGLGWRLNVLREQKRAPRDTPNVFNILDQMRLVPFLFQDKHRQIGDQLTTSLVLACRVLLVAGLVGMAALAFLR
jgi:hypothetical protein